MGQNIFTQANITPDVVQAGDCVEFVMTLTVGPDYCNGPTRLIFDFPGTLGYSRPSLMHQESNGYIEAYVDNPNVTYVKRIWDMEVNDFASRAKTSWRGMAARMAVLDLSAGLTPGDAIRLHWGDPGRGYGPGVQVTTVVPQPDYQDVVHVRYFKNQERGLPDFGRSFKGYQRPEPDSVQALPFKIYPRSCRTLRLIRKANGALLVPLDAFWNVASRDDSAELIEPAVGQATRNAMGAYEIGDKHIQLRTYAKTLLQGPAMDNVGDGYNIYWGDVHTHSMYSVDCVEREKQHMSPGDLMDFARLSAGLDFYAVTDHHEPEHDPRNHIGQANWEHTMEDVQSHDRSGEFLVFPGIEYRCVRGDTVILFNWLPAYSEIERPQWENIQKAWKELEGRDCMSIPHFHNNGRLPEETWWRNANEQHEPVLEIYSCHGSYEREDALENGRPLVKAFRADRSGAGLLQRGYKYGFVCNSDGHKGHVGLNGLTAVLAKSLDKAALLEAYRARRVYGTTNARIRLLFKANGHWMGTVLPQVEEKTFSIDITGESALKRIDLYRNTELIQRFLPDGKAFQTEWTIRDNGPSNWYVRATQLDNQIAFSSPIWFE